MSKNTRKKVILSASGTGGHLFPAQTLAHQISESCDVLFVAGGLKTNPFFDRTGFDFEEIPCTTFSLKNPLKVCLGGLQIIKGLRCSQAILRQFSPDLVVGFGSYYTLPLLLASVLKKIPIILHEQNAIPGKVNRLFSRFAHTTAITFPESAKYLKGQKVEVHFPIRTKKSSSKSYGWEYYGFSPEKKTLLVFGGSQGALFLNTVFLKTLSRLAEKLTSFQVLHFTGKNGNVLEAESYYRSLGIVHCVKEFEERMDIALTIADVALTRAGASTIAELIDAETPAVLIPFPFATNAHQVKNAEHFVKVVGGGKMLLEKTATPDDLASAFQELIEGLEEKKQKITLYKKKKELKELSQLILNL